MALSRNSEALRFIKIAKRIDKWKLLGRFDEAEIYLEQNKNELSINTYVNSIEAYVKELKDGIDNYLLACDSEIIRDKITELTQKALTEFFVNGRENKPFEKLKEDLNTIKDEIKGLQ